MRHVRRAAVVLDLQPEQLAEHGAERSRGRGFDGGGALCKKPLLLVCDRAALDDEALAFLPPP